PRPAWPPLCPYTTLLRSGGPASVGREGSFPAGGPPAGPRLPGHRNLSGGPLLVWAGGRGGQRGGDGGHPPMGRGLVLPRRAEPGGGGRPQPGPAPGRLGRDGPAGRAGLPAVSPPLFPPGGRPGGLGSPPDPGGFDAPGGPPPGPRG